MRSHCPNLQTGCASVHRKHFGAEGTGRFLRKPGAGELYRLDRTCLRRATVTNRLTAPPISTEGDPVTMRTKGFQPVAGETLTACGNPVEEPVLPAKMVVSESGCWSCSAIARTGRIASERSAAVLKAKFRHSIEILLAGLRPDLEETVSISAFCPAARAGQRKLDQAFSPGTSMLWQNCYIGGGVPSHACA